VPREQSDLTQPLQRFVEVQYILDRTFQPAADSDPRNIYSKKAAAPSKAVAEKMDKAPAMGISG
jgi:hypothetical protein